MSNRFLQSRELVVAALKQVTQRVWAYEPAKAASPGMWLGVALPGTRPTNNPDVVARTVRFPLTITYDGSSEAAVAGLDELTAKVVDTVIATPKVNLLGSRYGDPDGHQSIVLDLEVTLGINASFCTPTPAAAQMPPPIAQRSA